MPICAAWGRYGGIVVFLHFDLSLPSREFFFKFEWNRDLPLLSTGKQQAIILSICFATSLLASIRIMAKKTFDTGFLDLLGGPSVSSMIPKTAPIEVESCFSSFQNQWFLILCCSCLRCAVGDPISEICGGWRICCSIWRLHANIGNWTTQRDDEAIWNNIKTENRRRWC